MQLALIVAGYLTAVDMWADLWINMAPMTIVGYGHSDASRDLTTFAVLFLLYDRFFGPYGVTLRRSMKLLRKLDKENVE